MGRTFCPVCEDTISGTKIQTNYAEEDKTRYSRVICTNCGAEFVNAEKLHSVSIADFADKGMSKKLQQNYNGTRKRARKLGKRTKRADKEEPGKDKGKEGGSPESTSKGSDRRTEGED